MIIFRHEAHILDLKTVLKRLSLHTITLRSGIGNLLGKWITLLQRRGQSTAYFMGYFYGGFGLFRRPKRGNVLLCVYVDAFMCDTIENENLPYSNYRSRFCQRLSWNSGWEGKQYINEICDPLNKQFYLLGYFRLVCGCIEAPAATEIMMFCCPSSQDRVGGYTYGQRLVIPSVANYRLSLALGNLNSRCGSQ